MWQSGYESALGLPEELPLVVQLHSLATQTHKGDSTTENKVFQALFANLAPLSVVIPSIMCHRQAHS